MKFRIICSAVLALFCAQDALAEEISVGNYVLTSPYEPGVAKSYDEGSKYGMDMSAISGFGPRYGLEVWVGGRSDPRIAAAGSLKNFWAEHGGDYLWKNVGTGNYELVSSHTMTFEGAGPHVVSIGYGYINKRDGIQGAVYVASRMVGKDVIVVRAVVPDVDPENLEPTRLEYWSEFSKLVSSVKPNSTKANSTKPNSAQAGSGRPNGVKALK